MNPVRKKGVDLTVARRVALLLSLLMVVVFVIGMLDPMPQDRPESERAG